MTNMTINETRRTIVITKAMNKAASKFGTPEYFDLQTARSHYPGFRVVVKNTKTKTETYKGLTYAFMEKYIEAHDDAEKSIITEYRFKRGLTEDSPKVCSFKEVRDWFLGKFPEIAKLYNKAA